MVKEALFDILGDRVVGALFLDLYAGSGNIGIEALSRGAAKVVFVDRYTASMGLILENLSSLGIVEGFETYKMDSIKAVWALSRRGASFNIIFIDSPYFSGLGERSLEASAKGKILKDGGVVVLKHHGKDKSPTEVEGLSRTRVSDYGDTHLSFYSASSDGEDP
jgi:16S rRNA (guanine(966)-N(2))-methyltransferase RsmD